MEREELSSGIVLFQFWGAGLCFILCLQTSGNKKPVSPRASRRLVSAGRGSGVCRPRSEQQTLAQCL